MREWGPTSNLVGLATSLSLLFGDDPPLFSKAAASAAAGQQLYLVSQAPGPAGRLPPPTQQQQQQQQQQHAGYSGGAPTLQRGAGGGGMGSSGGGAYLHAGSAMAAGYPPPQPQMLRGGGTGYGFEARNPLAGVTVAGTGPPPYSEARGRWAGGEEVSASASGSSAHYPSSSRDGFGGGGRISVNMGGPHYTGGGPGGFFGQSAEYASGGAAPSLLQSPVPLQQQHASHTAGGMALNVGGGSHSYPSDYHFQPPPDHARAPEGPGVGGGDVGRRPAAAEAASAVGPSPSSASPEAVFREAAERELSFRLRASLAARAPAAAERLEALLDAQRNLEARGRELERGASALRREHEALEAQLAAVGAACGELEAWLVAHERDEDAEGPIDVDGAFLPADELTAQLLSAAADDAAAEDTLYALDQAVAQRVVEPSVYLRQVRAISREQFFARATLLRAGADARRLVSPPHQMPAAPAIAAPKPPGAAQHAGFGRSSALPAYPSLP